MTKDLMTAERQLRYWTRKVQYLRSLPEVSDASDASDASDVKEENEKRELPPTPPIERKAKEEKRSLYARAREDFSPVVVPSRDEVVSFIAELNSDVDPDVFIDYYNAKGKWPRDWKSALRNWGRYNFKQGRTKTKAKRESTVSEVLSKREDERVKRMSQQLIESLKGK